MTIMSASDIAAHRIREARKKRGWRVKDLADACAKAGAAHITAAVITNLETRRRPGREITAEELLTLAWVLEVPPLQFLAPLGGGEALQVVPGEAKDPADAAGWLTDDDMAVVPVWNARSPLARDTPRALRPGAAPLTMIRQVRAVTRALRIHERALTDRAYRQHAGGTDAYHENSITVLALRLLCLLEALEALGYQRLELPEAMQIMARHNLPATLAEWETDEDGKEGVPDGESA